MTTKINGTTEKIRKTLFNEVSLILSVVTVVLIVVFWVSSPQQEIEKQIVRLESQIESNEQVGALLQKFKDNDLHEMQLKLDRIEERQIEMIKAIARMEALIK